MCGLLKVHGYVSEIVRIRGNRDLECARRTGRQERKPSGEVDWSHEVKSSVAKLRSLNFTLWTCIIELTEDLHREKS